jgi:hypothetical protein
MACEASPSLSYRVGASRNTAASCSLSSFLCLLLFPLALLLPPSLSFLALLFALVHVCLPTAVKIPFRNKHHLRLSSDWRRSIERSAFSFVSSVVAKGIQLSRLCLSICLSLYSSISLSFSLSPSYPFCSCTACRRSLGDRRRGPRPSGTSLRWCWKRTLAFFSLPPSPSFSLALSRSHSLPDTLTEPPSPIDASSPQPWVGLTDPPRRARSSATAPSPLRSRPNPMPESFPLLPLPHKPSIKTPSSPKHRRRTHILSSRIIPSSSRWLCRHRRNLSLCLPSRSRPMSSLPRPSRRRARRPSSTTCHRHPSTSPPTPSTPRSSNKVPTWLSPLPGARRGRTTTRGR